MCWDQRTLELTLILGILTSKNDFGYKTHMNRVLLFRPHILGKKASVYINIEPSDSGAGEEMPTAVAAPVLCLALLLFSSVVALCLPEARRHVRTCSSTMNKMWLS